MDFRAWTQRASHFIRSLHLLPGKLELFDCIRPPDSDEYSQEWLTSDECSLPPAIKRFLSTASARTTFSYTWSVPSELQSRFREFVPEPDTLMGGGDLCEAATYHVAEAMSVFGMDSVQEERQHGRLPLMELERRGGALISVQVEPDGEARSVVYVPVTGEPCEISTSFEQFLIDWEKICYIRPTLENLSPWLDSATGLLDPDADKSAALRQHLMEAGAAVPE